MNLNQLGATLVSFPVVLATALSGVAQPNPPAPFTRPILPPLTPSPVLPSPRPSPELEIPPTLTPVTPEVPEDIPGSIRIRQFQFVGNQVFSDDQLQYAVAPFTGHYITSAQLRQALEAINQLYLESGYILSGVRIPGSLNQQRQAIDQVVVTVEVVEAQVEEIEILGANRLQNYLRPRLKQAVSPALNEAKLLEALILLQQDPLIQSLRAEIQPGRRQDHWILRVRVEPAPELRLQIGLDNSRSPGVGTLQRRLEFTHNNLVGLGDRLELGFFNTDGSNAGTGSYTFPFDAEGSTVQLATTILSSKIIEQPFNQLDLISDYRSYELTVRHPLLRQANERSTQELALGLTASRQESESSLLGVPFPLSAGADDEGKTRISALRFFQEYTQQSARESLALRSEFSIGLGLAATINTEPPDSRFFHWRGDGQYVRLLAPDTPLLIRLGVQAADRELVSIEQLGLGGPNTVRGYRRDLLLANSGAYASVEARVPLFRSARLPALLQIAPFFDLGTSFDGAQNLGEESSRVLASVGVGLQLQMAERLFIRLDYGIPLVPVATQGSSLQEQGFTFAVHYNPL